MKYKAIIFDMDGTIVDTNMVWLAATRELLSRRDITLTPELLRTIEERACGAGTIPACQAIKEVTGLVEPIELLVEEKLILAGELFAQGIRFIPGFPEFHTRMQEYNLKSSLATNADTIILQVTNQILKLDRFFGTHLYNIAYVNNVCKPAPDVFLYAAKQLNVRPEECIVVEDSHTGLTAAKEAGMFCIGINSNKNRAALARADIIIDGYHEVDLEQLLH